MVSIEKKNIKSGRYLGVNREDMSEHPLIRNFTPIFLELYSHNHAS